MEHPIAHRSDAARNAAAEFGRRSAIAWVVPALDDSEIARRRDAEHLWSKRLAFGCSVAGLLVMSTISVISGVRDGNLAYALLSPLAWAFAAPVLGAIVYFLSALVIAMAQPLLWGELRAVPIELEHEVVIESTSVWWVYVRELDGRLRLTGNRGGAISATKSKSLAERARTQGAAARICDISDRLLAEQAGRMLLCPGPIPVSFVRTSCGSPGTVVPV